MWSGSVGGSVATAYDHDFRVAGVAVNGQNVALSYDADDLLVSAGSLTLTRNPANGLLAGSQLGSVTDESKYDALGEVTSYVARYAGAPLISWSYVRDGGGRIVSRSETAFGVSSVETYGYDAGYRLVTVSHDGSPSLAIGYDPNGNRTSIASRTGTIAATYDEQDRLIAFGDESYTYAPGGELVQKTTPSGVTAFTYDGLGSLRKAVTPSSTVEYVLDAMGRRVGRKVDGVLQQGWLYDTSSRIVAQLDGSGTVTRRFVYASRPHTPDLMIRGDRTYRFICDHLGSPRLVIDADTGAIAQYLQYDVFGRITGDSAPGFQPFGYAGGLYDPITRLVRFGVRDYDPHTGRWTTKDPIGFAGGDTNLYAYVLNDPVNLIDPMGTDWLETTASFSAGLGDALLLGFGDELRDWTDEQFGWNGGAFVDKCSSAYRAGGWTGFAAGGARIGYAAAAKGISIVAASGAAASAGRQQLKAIFRFGMGMNWRLPDLAGKSDAALRASAGRTNPFVNTYGAGVAAGGAGCRCP